MGTGKKCLGGHNFREPKDLMIKNFDLKNSSLKEISLNYS